MKDLLVVVDMQVNFVNGALRTKEAEQIVDSVVCRVKKSQRMWKRHNLYPGYPWPGLSDEPRGKEASGASMY